MKFPEIDPELHGLLDEVVTDPRSALRRTPRRALLQWFGNPDSAHARPIDATTAERHLVAVYRESLAELLLRAAWLAYHDQPELRHGPRRPDGRAVDGKVERTDWKARVGRARSLDYQIARAPEALTLLDSCLAVLDPSRAVETARMAVALVPSDFGKLRLALALPPQASVHAIRLLQHLCNRGVSPHVRKDAHNDLAVRMLGLGWLHLARQEYNNALLAVPEGLEARFYAFNLACLSEDTSEVLEHSSQLASLCSEDDEQLREAVVILRAWRATCSTTDLDRARRHARRVSLRLSALSLVLTGAYE